MAAKNLPRTVSGTTLRAINYEIVNKDLTLATIVLKVSKQGKLFLIKTVGSGITMVNAAEGKFKLDAFLVQLRAGAYRYNLHITVDGIEQRYAYGIWIIVSPNE